jgi:hypothetical protein
MRDGPLTYAVSRTLLLGLREAMGLRAGNQLGRPVAEDTDIPKQVYPTCKRGHPRTPENTEYVSTRPDRPRCIPCRREADVRFYHSHREERLAKNAAWRHANTKYLAAYDDARNSTTRRWIAAQERRLRGERERVQAKLESLKKEEEEACRKLAALLIATR